MVQMKLAMCSSTGPQQVGGGCGGTHLQAGQMATLLLSLPVGGDFNDDSDKAIGRMFESW